MRTRNNQGVGVILSVYPHHQGSAAMPCTEKKRRPWTER